MAEIELRSMDHEGYAEHRLSFAAGPQDDPASVLAQVAGRLRAAGVQVIQERLYGRASARVALLEARRAAGSAEGPVRFLDGRPVHDGPLAGGQVWGLSSRDGAPIVTTAQGGRAWRVAGHEGLYLPGGPGATEASALAQGRALFSEATGALTAAGFEYGQVVRTWIYVRRLLAWYDDLNAIRDAHHEAVGVGPAFGGTFPASTGIQGRAAEEECLMEVLAVRGEGVEVTPILTTARQRAASDYGSAFSRGVALRVGAVETVYVSGTASLGADGQTRHVGDIWMQCVETLLSVGAVLAERGASLADIQQATLYCKTPEVAAAYGQVVRLLDVPDFPTVQVIADVCRSDLLVELEAVAVV